MNNERTNVSSWVPTNKLIGINGKQYYLWRAVDQGGEVVDMYLQAKRDGVAAKRFLGSQAAVSNLFNLATHKIGVERYRGLRISAFKEWSRAVA